MKRSYDDNYNEDELMDAINTGNRKQPVRKSTRKSSNVPEKNNNKKRKKDKELLNLLMGPNLDDDDSDYDDLDEEEEEEEEVIKEKCPNPLCDHISYNVNAYKPLQAPAQLNNISDLIQLGKTYHCKMNTLYYGINLKLMCNLIEPLTKLKNMIGMDKVKEHMVNQIIFFLQHFNQKEKCNVCLDCICNKQCSKNLNNDMLHTVITGPPGVGKTELGKILGHVYKAMGVLSNGEMNIATRSDLVGKYLGHTATKTQEFIDKCKGGVMFIDEAYSLGHPEGRDSFSKECIDTLNQNMSERRDFLVIIAGYGDALDKSFFSMNEGLKRRFTFRYDITGYTSNELLEIFLLKVKNDGWKTEFDINNQGLKVVELFEKNINYFPHFGGDIESFLLNCKVIHGRRVVFLDQNHKKVLTLSDIEGGLEKFIEHRKYNDDKKDMSDSYKRMYL